MILGRKAIQNELRDGNILCDPAPAKIETTHIDVRVGSHVWYARFEVEEMEYLNLETLDPKEVYRYQDETVSGVITLPPRSVTLGHTDEFIGTTVPWITSQLDTRSTLARWGIPIHMAAGLGDPGFVGRWTLEILNPWPMMMKIPVGARVGCIQFHEVRDNDEVYDEVGRYNNMRETWHPDSMLPRIGNL